MRPRPPSGRCEIYPYSQRDNPPTLAHIRPDGRKWHGEQPRGLAYWELLSRLINEEPAIERDRIMLAGLIPLGIEKGKSFKPDERQKKILMQASDVGELMARANGYAKRFPGVVVWPGKKWEYSLFLKETDQEATNNTQLDERSSWFYEAVGVTVGMMGRTVGAGQVYLEVFEGQQGSVARRRQAVHTSCAQGCAGGAVLVLHRLRQREPLFR